MRFIKKRDCCKWWPCQCPQHLQKKLIPIYVRFCCWVYPLQL